MKSRQAFAQILEAQEKSGGEEEAPSTHRKRLIHKITRRLTGMDDKVEQHPRQANDPDQFASRPNPELADRRRRVSGARVAS